MAKALKLKKPLDLNEWAYKAIKLRILNNEIKPGSQLNIEAISKELNISRTPIREALLRLKQSGLVIALPRVGFFVCGITKKDFEDIFEIRHLIETYAAEKLARRISDEEIQYLIDTMDCSELMAEQGNFKKYNEYDAKLHGFIIDSVNNNKMGIFYESVDDLTYRMRMYATRSPENVRQSLIEHRKIVDTFARRDAPGARLAMEEHIVSIRNRLKLLVDFQDETANR